MDNQNAGWRGKIALGALGFSLFTVVWFMAAALGSRFGLWGWKFGLTTMTFDWGMKIVFAALGLSVIAILVSLIQAPRKRPFILALAALLLAGLSFGRVGAFGGQAARLPPIHDVQTDWAAPIQPSAELLAARTATGALNAIEDAPTVPAAAAGRWPGTEGRLVSELQEEAEFDPEVQEEAVDAPYPKLDTYVTPLTPGEAHAIVMSVVEDRGWDIVTSDVPAGRIEATETSFWFGFKDDVMIRILPEEAGGARIDVRSVSRVGLSDVGANAKRVRNLLDDIEIAFN